MKEEKKVPRTLLVFFLIGVIFKQIVNVSIILINFSSKFSIILIFASHFPLWQAAALTESYQGLGNISSKGLIEEILLANAISGILLQKQINV